MTNIIVKIMVEVLSALALATKEIRRGRFSKLIIPIKFVISGHSAVKFIKKLSGENKVEAVLQRLALLTEEEARMVAALTLREIHDRGSNVKAKRKRSKFFRLTGVVALLALVVGGLNN
jgi:hypothetical protein